MIQKIILGFIVLAATARFADVGFIVRCGTLVRDESGKCNQFRSHWPEKDEPAVVKATVNP